MIINCILGVVLYISLGCNFYQLIINGIDIQQCTKSTKTELIMIPIVIILYWPCWVVLLLWKLVGDWHFRKSILPKTR